MKFELNITFIDKQPEKKHISPIKKLLNQQNNVMNLTKDGNKAELKLFSGIFLLDVDRLREKIISKLKWKNIYKRIKNYYVTVEKDGKHNWEIYFAALDFLVQKSCVYDLRLSFKNAEFALNFDNQIIPPIREMISLGKPHVFVFIGYTNKLKSRENNFKFNAFTKSLQELCKNGQSIRIDFYWLKIRITDRNIAIKPKYIRASVGDLLIGGIKHPHQMDFRLKVFLNIQNAPRVYSALNSYEFYSDSLIHIKDEALSCIRYWKKLDSLLTRPFIFNYRLQVSELYEILTNRNLSTFLKEHKNIEISLEITETRFELLDQFPWLKLTQFTFSVVFWLKQFKFLKLHFTQLKKLRYSRLNFKLVLKKLYQSKGKLIDWIPKVLNADLIFAQGILSNLL